MFILNVTVSGYIQSDGTAIGASLAVKLANVQLKPLKHHYKNPELKEDISKSDQNRNCKYCNQRVAFHGNGAKRGSCKNGIHSNAKR